MNLLLTHSIPAAVLFDWDNTLVDTWPLIHGGMCAVFEKRGLVPWTLQEVKDRCHESGREAFPKLFPDDWQSALDDFYEYIHKRHVEDLIWLPFAPELIERLSVLGIPLGLVSNKTKVLLVKEVEHLGFSAYFGAIAGAGDALYDKPDPAPMFLVLDQLNIQPSRNVWMIGDTPVDWKAAKSANLLAIGICMESMPEGIDVPDIIIPDLSVICTLLTELCAKTQPE
ncbi:MAG: HAD-IA family hydrolase [Pseudomonadota bacterium]